MRVILLRDVPNLGKKYEIKNVSDGHARNFLIPRKFAKFATPQSIREIELLEKRAVKEKEIRQDLLEKNLAELQGLRISIKEKANEKGHLFASINAEDVSKILKKEQRLEIPPEMIEMEKPIKEIGEHKIKVRTCLPTRQDREFILIVTSNENYPLRVTGYALRKQ